MNLGRSSGILLHPTSLPNGVLDEHAYRFVDWLAAAGQRWWQVLPLGPPEGLTGSPYMSPSAFAGSPELVAARRARVPRTDADAFRAEHSYWIDDWIDFGGTLDDQVRFEREWRELRAYAAARNVRVFGDIPIYVSYDGSDHRAHPTLFRAGEVAGVPPDAFSKTGQLWGNPLYDWPAMRADGYRWWIERLRRMFALVDLTRIDHFRGFVSYWAVPARNRTAVKGRWLRGPGADLFRALQAALGDLPLVAEDLGVITEAVVRLRRELGLPGMAVLQFAVGNGSHEPASAPAPQGALRRLHRDARQRHDARLVGVADGGRARLDRARSRPPRLELDRGRVDVASGARDRALAGRPRTRRRSSNEPARHRAWQLALEVHTGRVDRRQRVGAPRAHSTKRTIVRGAGGGSRTPMSQRDSRF